MEKTASETDRAAFLGVLGELEAAWNEGDGAAFGVPMAEDADFVTIPAEHLRGRKANAASHAHIFSTIYAGSRNRLTLGAARLLRDDVALIHVRSVLEAPTGPLSGRHEARFSAVLTRDDGRWSIASFHITLAPSAPA